MNELCLEAVSKSLNKNPVLCNVSVRFDSGRIYGLYGRNGAGKTMLLRAIAGLLIPDSGTITAFGEKIGIDVSFPSDTGILFDHVGLWPHYTGMQCLTLLASIRGRIGSEDIRLALKRVGLDPHDKRTYRQYSLGMKQRLLLA